jgi:hypothetical protein
VCGVRGDGFVFGIVQRLVLGIVQRLVLGFVQRLVLGFVQRLVLGFIERLVLGFVERLVLGFIERLVLGFVLRRPRRLRHRHDRHCVYAGASGLMHPRLQPPAEREGDLHGCRRDHLLQ